MTVLGCLGMMLSQQLGGKAMNNTALVFVGEAEELVACEVSGMGSSQVEKMSLLLVEAKVSQPVELMLMRVEARFGVHAVVDFPSVENHGLGGLRVVFARAKGGGTQKYWTKERAPRQVRVQ
jgi:hypothetical protein